MSAPFDELIALADLDVDLIALERSRGALPARTELAALAERFAEIERARSLLEPERAPLAASLSSLEEEVARLAERRAAQRPRSRRLGRGTARRGPGTAPAEAPERPPGRWGPCCSHMRRRGREQGSVSTAAE